MNKVSYERYSILLFFLSQKETELCPEQDEIQKTKEGFQQTESIGTKEERYEWATSKIRDYVVRIITTLKIYITMFCSPQFTWNVWSYTSQICAEKNNTLVYWSIFISKSVVQRDKTHLAFFAQHRDSDTYSNLKMSLFTSLKLKLAFEVITVNRIIRWECFGHCC